MEILRVPPYNTDVVISVSDASTEYEYAVLDMADSSITHGNVTSNSSSKVVIPLPAEYDNTYTITIEDEEYIVDVVRPYVDPNTKGETATDIESYRKNEELARAIIDSVVEDGFYYKKKVYSTVGLGADLLPVWGNVKKLLKLYENNVLVFDSLDPDSYTIKYEVDKTRFGIQELTSETINRNESAPNLLPAAGSDMLDFNFIYRGFPRGFDYLVVAEFGYKKIPSDIVRATELLVEDIECGKLDYYKRYISDYNTDQFKIKFDAGVFDGTGNILVDKILSKYNKPINILGVL
jgi:hypothetical protein